MEQDNVALAFDTIIRDINAAIEGLNDEGAEAFLSGRYEDVNRLRQRGEALAGFSGEVEQLLTVWVTQFDATTPDKEAQVIVDTLHLTLLP